MKKLLLAFLAIAMLAVLVACDPAQVTTSIKITDTAGAGTKTFSAKILKDGQPKYLDKDGKIIEKNGKHWIGGVDKTVAKLNEVCPIEGATIEAGESTDAYDTIIFSYSWANIDEYNEKTKSLAIDGFDIADAELIVDGDNVTFKEPASNQFNSIMWALDTIYNDPELYDLAGDTNIKNDSLAKIYDVKITIGDNTEQLRYTKDEEGTDIATNPDVEVTGNVAAAGEEPTGEEPTGEEPAAEESPKTADNGIVAFVTMLTIAGAALLVTRKRVLN